MVRTQIQMPEDEYRKLREVARRQGRSMADCIREGVELFLKTAQGGRRDLASVPSFRAHPVEDLKDHDAWWTEEAVGKSSPRR